MYQFSTLFYTAPTKCKMTVSIKLVLDTRYSIPTSIEYRLSGNFFPQKCYYMCYITVKSTLYLVTFWSQQCDRQNIKFGGCTKNIAHVRSSLSVYCVILFSLVYSGFRNHCFSFVWFFMLGVWCKSQNIGN